MGTLLVGLGRAKLGRTRTNPLLFLAPLNGSLAYRDRAGNGSLSGSGAVRWQPAKNAVVNLFPNPRFQNNITGLSGQAGGSTARVTNDGVSGLTALQVNSSGAASSGVISTTPSIPAAHARMVPGVPYTMTFWHKLVSGDGANWVISLNGFNASAFAGSSASGGGLGFVATGQWTKSVRTFTPAVTGLHYAGLAITNGVAAGSILVTDVQITQSAAEQPFVNPDTAVWLDPLTGVLGTAHGSPSVSQAAEWTEEGTTNGVTDPIFGNATITTGWALGNQSTTATMARDTTYSLFGQASAFLSFGTNALDKITQAGATCMAGTQGQVFTVSAYVRAHTAADIGKSVRIGLCERDASSAAIADQIGTVVVLTDSWQRVVFTATVGQAATAKVGPEIFNGAAAVATAFNVDGFQIEQKSYASSLAAGSLGTGYSWAGTAHASTSTRAATVLSVPAAARVNTVVGSAAARYQRLGGVGGSPRLWEVGGYSVANGDHLNIDLTAPYTTAGMQAYTNGAAGQAVRTLATTLAVWDVVFGRWDASTLAVSSTAQPVEGVTARTVAPLGVLQPTDLNMRLGAGVAGSFNANGALQGVAVFDRAMTDRDKAKLNATPLWDWRMLDAA